VGEYLVKLGKVALHGLQVGELVDLIFIFDLTRVLFELLELLVEL